MSDRTSPPALRVIAPCAVLLGTGDGDSLENVNTTELPNGALCWVNDQAHLYYLDKTSSAVPSPPDSIAPGSGPGRWFQVSGGSSGGGIPMPDGTLVLPQGANFINEPGLGFFRSSPGIIGLAVGGFLGLELSKGVAAHDGPLSVASLAASGGTPLVDSPDIRLISSAWDGMAAQNNEILIRVVPSAARQSKIAFYQVTGLGTSLLASIFNDADAPQTVLDLLDGKVKVAEVFSGFHIDLVVNGGNLGARLDAPGSANSTALMQLLMRDASNANTAKDVSQGAPDSAGVGKTALVVANDAALDTTVAAGDFVLTGWGTNPVIAIDAGSTCRRGTIQITTGTVSTDPNWTIQLTFPVAFDAAPFAICEDNSSPTTNGIASPRVETISTTQLLIQGRGDDAPLVGGSVYRITWMVME